MSCGEKHSALILPDTTYYEEGNEKGPELLAIWRQMMEKLLAKFDFSEEEIKDILDKVIAGGRRIGQICLVERRKIRVQQTLPSL